MKLLWPGDTVHISKEKQGEKDSFTLRNDTGWHGVKCGSVGLFDR